MHGVLTCCAFLSYLCFSVVRGRGRVVVFRAFFVFGLVSLLLFCFPLFLFFDAHKSPSSYGTHFARWFLGTQCSNSSSSRLACSWCSVCVLILTTSPNSGVKIFWGVSEVGKKRFLCLFLTAVRLFLGFLFFSAAIARDVIDVISRVFQSMFRVLVRLPLHPPDATVQGAPLPRMLQSVALARPPWTIQSGGCAPIPPGCSNPGRHIIISSLLSSAVGGGVCASLVFFSRALRRSSSPATPHSSLRSLLLSPLPLPPFLASLPPALSLSASGPSPPFHPLPFLSLPLWWLCWGTH